MKNSSIAKNKKTTKKTWEMFDWVLNTLKIPSSNIISHAYESTADRRFSGLVYCSYVIYILNIRNGLKKTYITKR